ncbi:FAD binding protein [Frankia torreyi]|uniref:FAD binding protein n=1 Tax=Frankia torreyi TaxID=1856 RepID=A0A0D8BEC2_9ACTN|nr:MULTISPECIES: FAD-dependent monooxygenase [Frankia]KJE22400.1 FAD binding protein [Frankia torreyi]KQM05004.1 FAD binding protein [Frankia sp. CpI1-P]
MEVSVHPTKIAVVGAGPGGLTCARVLQRHGIDVTVYDLDASVDARPQGGSLDMHADSGQVALAAAGLLDAFHALARPEGQQMRVLGRDAGVLLDLVPDRGDDGAPEIDRGQLRALLLDALVPGTVRWGHSVTRLEPLGGGAHRSTSPTARAPSMSWSSARTGPGPGSGRCSVAPSRATRA